MLMLTVKLASVQEMVNITYIDHVLQYKQTSLWVGWFQETPLVLYLLEETTEYWVIMSYSTNKLALDWLVLRSTNKCILY